jgi:glycosyltransferase involved in cell wall biosynthesis
MNAPLVSVLMTAYNRAPFVGEAIESVLRSTIEDLELIIVDDASTDDTAAIARRYAARDERVRVYVNDANLGDYPNRNKAASYARGTYLKYLDSDDALYPHGLAAMVWCMEACPDAGFGLSAVADVAGPYPRRLLPREAYREHFFVRDLFGRAPGSAIILRSAFEAVGGFSGKRQVGDHELWLALARRFPLVKMPRDLVWDREHPSQEKWYDPPGRKLAMHQAVDLAALAHPECPLDAAERAEARRRLADAGARAFWFSLLAPQGVRQAPNFLEDVGLGVQDVTGWLWRRGATLIRRGGAS